ncbi:hypothetical protein [Nitratifractor sp.]
MERKGSATGNGGCATVMEPEWREAVRAFLRVNWPLLILFVIVGGIGFSRGFGAIEWIIVGGALLLVFNWYRGYRRECLYDAIHRHLALGDYDGVLSRIDRLRRLLGKRVQPEILVDLYGKEARIYACLGKMEEAMERYGAARAYASQIAETIYLNILAMIYYEAGEYDRFVETIRRIDALDTDVGALDLAFALARFGSAREAEERLRTVRNEDLPDFGHFLYLWTEAMIRERRGDPAGAIDDYERMEEAIGPYRDNSILWIPIALARGYHAAALAENGRHTDGERLLEGTDGAIVQIHADDRLRMRLCAHFPDRIACEPFCVRDGSKPRMGENVE